MLLKIILLCVALIGIFLFGLGTYALSKAIVNFMGGFWQ